MASPPLWLIRVCHQRLGFFDCCDDVAIGATAAKVAAHLLANGLAAVGTSFTHKPDGRADLPRCAVPALKRIVGDESPLHRVQHVAAGQPLDGHQVCAVAHDGQGQASIDALAVAQHRAGATLAVVAAFFGTYQVQLFTQQVEQGGPRVDCQCSGLTIEGQADGVFCSPIGRERAHGRSSRSGFTQLAASLLCDPGGCENVPPVCQAWKGGCGHGVTACRRYGGEPRD